MAPEIQKHVSCLSRPAAAPEGGEFHPTENDALDVADEKITQWQMENGNGESDDDDDDEV